MTVRAPYVPTSAKGTAPPMTRAIPRPHASRHPAVPPSMSSHSDRTPPRTHGSAPSFSTLLWLNRHQLASRYPSWRPDPPAPARPTKKAS